MLLREFTQEGIVDVAVVFHKELNPKLWQGKELKSKVRYKLLQIAKHFIEFIDIPSIKLQDVTISGSNAAYTYTENSDLDLHLVVKIPPAAQFHLKPLYDAKKNQYNFNHNIKIKGIDVEVYVQPDTDVHHSAGIYSVLDNKWLSEPTAERVSINDADVEDKVRNYLNKIKLALRSDDIEVANRVKDRINSLRKTGLETAGEFSVENVAFKVLRAKGYIDQLRQHIYNLQDKALSLENLKMKRHEVLRKESVATGTVTAATGNEVEITDPATKVKTTVPVNSPMLGKDAEGNLVLHNKPTAGGTQTAPGQPPKPEPIKPGTKVAIASEDSDNEVRMDTIEAWRDAVLSAYPKIADRIKFKGMDSQIVAMVPGLDRAFGVFDLESESGEVLGESDIEERRHEGDEDSADGVLSPVSGQEDHDEISKLLVQKLKRLAGL